MVENGFSAAGSGMRQSTTISSGKTERNGAVRRGDEPNSANRFGTAGVAEARR